MKHIGRFLILFSVVCTFYVELSHEMYVLRDFEVECRNQTNFYNLTADDIHWFTECPETAPVTFGLFCNCVLKAEGIVNNDMELIESKYEEVNNYNINMLRILRNLPVNKEKMVYTQKIHRAVNTALFHEVPTFCKDGNLNGIWNQCRAANKLSNISVKALTARINEQENPNNDVKGFILCGLQKDMFLTMRGKLFKPKVFVHTRYKHVLKELQDVPTSLNKTEYAWQIFKVLRGAE